jgi:hypothetical protein
MLCVEKLTHYCTVQGRPQTQEESDTRDVPGPGTYDQDAPLGDAPAFSIPKAGLDAGHTEATPGPGEYDGARFAKNGPAFTIPAAGITEALSEKCPSPGPGEYGSSLVPVGPAFSIPVAQTPATKENEAFPGPGEYGKDVCLTVRSGPAYSMAGKYVPFLRLTAGFKRTAMVSTALSCSCQHARNAFYAGLVWSQECLKEFFLHDHFIVLEFTMQV